jgi:CRP/FNR family transcriptional regulator, cyclic AMP receptor protein
MEPESLERSLRAHPFVAELSDEHVRFLVGCAKNAHFEPGEYLFRENGPADALFLLRSGRVALESHLPGRGAVQVETVCPGDAIGWSVLFAPHKWHLDGRAVEPTLAFALDGACIRSKTEADSGFGHAFTRRLLLEVHQRLVRARLQQLDVYKAELR